MSIIKIALVDDHQLFREGVESILNQKCDLKVIMLAHSGRNILNQLKETDNLPDIILLDLDMPDLGGLETLPIVKKKYPEIKVVILSLHADLLIVKKMIDLGASGYLCKGGNVKGILETIYKVNEYGFFIDPKVEKELRENKTVDNILPLLNNDKDTLLNDSEKTILKLICKQKSNKEIANLIKENAKFVEYHRANLLKKTNSINVVGLVYYAMENMLDID